MSTLELRRKRTFFGVKNQLSRPDLPGGASLARAYGFCRPGKRSVTRQEERTE
ncbi:hypothetical protein [Enterobacter kobei]|jgi:hypothetical protein|uniref:hypothetical protein n=1 Tax=Enterobacter kobei TaxID=208224 RepID=UPI00200405E1|nr:hypothetical protein [Enterobacter kobei]MCK6725046.1 hypothetical protein [Enterobacter kobei]